MYFVKLNNKLRSLLGMVGVYCLCVSSPLLAALSPQQQQTQDAQVAALQAATQLFMHRGEGRQPAQAELAEAALGSLQQHSQGLAVGDLQASVPAYRQQVQQALAYDLSSPDLPWDFNLNFSNALSSVLQGLQQNAIAAKAQPTLSAEQALLWDLPARFQYLATRYTARAYVGDLEPLSEDANSFLAQDLDQQTAALDNDLKALAAALEGRADVASRLRDVQIRWRFIHGRLLNYNDDMAPLIVERSCRDIVTHLQALQRSL